MTPFTYNRATDATDALRLPRRMERSSSAEAPISST